MPKNESNIKSTEAFISRVLASNFKQTVRPEELRKAAEKLCAAIPDGRKKAA